MHCRAKKSIQTYVIKNYSSNGRPIQIVKDYGNALTIFEQSRPQEIRSRFVIDGNCAHIYLPYNLIQIIAFSVHSIENPPKAA